MFAMFRFLFYTFVAVVVGVVIGTVPIEGRTIADRLTAAFGDKPAKVAKPSTAAPQKPAAKTAPATETKRAARAAPPKPAPQGPVSAGAANTPDNRTEEEREDLAKIIATRARK